MTDPLNDSCSMETISEHDVTRVIAGNVESARQRLVVALEQLGYRVVSENPLRAKHNARGGGHYYLAANALDYPTWLEIGLRPQGQGARQVTFDYQVQHGYFTSGDRQTLTREAEAILAVASQHGSQLTCAGVASEARFCRKCGAPARTQGPAELEVLRLTAGARAGYQWTGLSLLPFFIAGILPLIALLTGKSANKLLVMAAIISAFGAWALAAGLRRTHLTLNPRQEKEELRLPTYSPPIAVSVTNELPPQTAYSSITEGTTDLLPSLQESEAIPVRPRNENYQA